MTGQDAVNVAERFAEAVDYDGVILTKLDGDARGGAALAVRAVTGKPIKYVSVGEKLDQLEPFHPDRMASRILGMGDVMGADRARAGPVRRDSRRRRWRRKMRKRRLHARRPPRPAAAGAQDDAASGMAGLLGMVPGVGRQLRNMKFDESQVDRVGGDHPLHDAGRAAQPAARSTAAGGGGSPPAAAPTSSHVNQVLGQLKQMERMMKQMKAGKMPNLGALMGR